MAPPGAKETRTARHFSQGEEGPGKEEPGKRRDLGDGNGETWHRGEKGEEES